MKPVIGYDIVSNLWSVSHEGKREMLSAEQLAEKYGIFNPIIYCQQQGKGHAKPAGDVKHEDQQRGFLL